MGLDECGMLVGDPRRGPRGAGAQGWARTEAGSWQGLGMEKESLEEQVWSVSPKSLPLLKNLDDVARHR